MTIESTKTFSRVFRGYDPREVDAHIEALTAKQQLLVADVESLRARLKESGDEVAALRKEVAVLTETSPTPHAMQQRMAKMLRRAVDEVSQMQAEARAEAEELIAAAEAKAEAEQQKHEEELAELTARRDAMKATYHEAKKALDAELTRMQAETQSAIEDAWQDAQQARDELLADAKLEADHYREQARRAVDEATAQRTRILEQLMDIYRDLETVPAALESAYRELKNPPDDSAMPAGQKVSTG